MNKEDKIMMNISILQDQDIILFQAEEEYDALMNDLEAGGYLWADGTNPTRTKLSNLPPSVEAIVVFSDRTIKFTTSVAQTRQNHPSAALYKVSDLIVPDFEPADSEELKGFLGMAVCA